MGYEKGRLNVFSDDLSHIRVDGSVGFAHENIVD